MEENIDFNSVTKLLTQKGNTNKVVTHNLILLLDTLLMETQPDSIMVKNILEYDWTDILKVCFCQENENE
jgi:hypothetical protein